MNFEGARRKGSGAKNAEAEGTQNAFDTLQATDYARIFNSQRRSRYERPVSIRTILDDLAQAAQRRLP
tara:strand:- start:29 stop:232 length:204 start_codon:yes stop_codon:yes gene_type:complete